MILVHVRTDTPEERILRVLLDRYPIDTDEVSKLTGMKKRDVERFLKGMEARGWITLERLSERIFIRLRRFDFTFYGRSETQRKALKHKKKGKTRTDKSKLLRDEHDDMMYT